VPRELGGGGRLARALQAREQNDHGRLGAQVQALAGLPHHGHELVVDDLDEGLPGGQALHHLGAQGARLDRVCKGLDHRHGDIGFEQGHAHLAQGVSDVVLGQASAPAQRVHRLAQAFGQGVEHGKSSSGEPSPGATRGGDYTCAALMGPQPRYNRPAFSGSRIECRA
jgi:hypothetical protein